MNNIYKAIELDKKLPEKARKTNSHLNELKEEFFDEESGMEESLDEIKEFIKKEQKSLNCELDKINTDMKNLTLQSTELNPEYNTKKREGSESTDSQPSSKKRSLMMMETIMVDQVLQVVLEVFLHLLLQLLLKEVVHLIFPLVVLLKQILLILIKYIDWIFFLKALFGDDDYMS